MGAKRIGDLSGCDILAKHGAQHLHHEGDRRATSPKYTCCAGGRCWPRAKAREELSHPAAESPALFD